MNKVQQMNTMDKVKAGMVKRRAAEKRFKSLGIFAIALGMLFLVMLFKDSALLQKHKKLLEIY